MMSNDGKKLCNESLVNIALLSLKQYEAAYKRRKYAEEASRRFFQSVLQLDGEQHIEFRLTCDERITCEAVAHSVQYVSTDDFRWIFNRCADSVEAVPSGNDPMRPEKRVAYALHFTPGETEDKEKRLLDDFASLSSSEENFQQMLKQMQKTGASISIQAGADGKGAFSGRVIIELPSFMTLRMRTMISFAFRGTRAEIITDGENMSQGDMPLHCIQPFMAGILEALMKQKKEEKPEIPDEEGTQELTKADGETNTVKADDQTDQADASTPKTSKTPIEELGLSVRSYGCLKRAGIDSVEKLQTLSEEDFRHIRNLGRKSMNEIKHRLKEYIIINDLDFMNAEPVQLDGPSYTDMLNKLVGLEDVKEQVRKITAFAKMKQDMERLGKTDMPVVLNMAFTGNPGTAKTTVARIIAGILNEVGLLSTNEIVETGRADLVAKYEGQTADKVKSVFLKAKGKLLFIDEAYSLLENWEGEFGDEAINTIVQEMENNRNETVVVFAGYPDKMKDFLDRNPGLRSRVPYHIHFTDYSAEEMMDIARMEAENRGFTILPEAKEKLESICKKACGHPEMGNGRFCRNLVENAILNYASRCYGEGENEPAGEFVLTADDFVLPDDLKEAKETTPMGFLA